MIELIIVIGIVATAAAIVLPAAMGGTAHHRVAAAARTLFAHAQNARTESVSRGWTVRLTVDMDAESSTPGDRGAWYTDWEADPFGAPGEFERVPGPWGRLTPAGDDVRVLGVRLQPETGRQLDGNAEQLTGGQAILEFRADGTCTAAEIWLASGTDDAEQIIVTVDGVTGRVRIVTPSEFERELAFAEGRNR